MRIKERLLPLLTVALVLLFWQLVAVVYGIEMIIPTPATTWERLTEVLVKSEFWTGVWNTLVRSVVAFLIAFFGALGLALLSRASKVFYKLFYPVVVMLRALPTIAVIFICYIAIRGWYRAVLIALLVIFPTLYASFYTAFMGCSGELAEVNKVYGVSKRHVLLKFIIPSVWASMYSDIVNTLSLTVKLINAAEAVTATSNSLGDMMAAAKSNFEMAEVFAYTIVAVALSYFTELVIRLTARIVKEVSKKCRLH